MSNNNNNNNTNTNNNNNNDSDHSDTALFDLPRDEPPSELHRIVRGTTFPRSNEQEDGAIFCWVPPELTSISLPQDECPLCFRDGIQSQLSEKRQSKKSKRDFQRCTGDPRHIFFFRHLARASGPPPIPLSAPSAPLAAAILVASSPPYQSPPQSDVEEGPVQPPDGRRRNAAGNPFCSWDGCSKIQQARTCINGCCHDHCAEICFLNHTQHGKVIRACPSLNHQLAAEQRLKLGGTSSTSPRRTRSGQTTTQSVLTQTVKESSYLSQPAHGRSTSASQRQVGTHQQAATRHVATPTRPVAPPPASGSRAGLAMPYALPMDSNQHNMYEKLGPTDKQKRELDAQTLARAKRDEVAMSSTFMVWYWASQDGGANSMRRGFRLKRQSDRISICTLADQPTLIATLEIYRQALKSILYFDPTVHDWISITLDIPVRISHSGHILLKLEGIDDSICNKLEETKRLAFGVHVKESHAAIPDAKGKRRAISPLVSPPAKRQQSASRLPYRFIPLEDDDDDDDAPDNSIDHPATLRRSLSWIMREPAEYVLDGLEKMEELRDQGLERKDAFKIAFPNRRWIPTTWQRHEAVRNALDTATYQEWMTENAKRPWKDLHDLIRRQQAELTAAAKLAASLTATSQPAASTSKPSLTIHRNPSIPTTVKVEKQPTKREVVDLESSDESTQSPPVQHRRIQHCHRQHHRIQHPHATPATIVTSREIIELDSSDSEGPAVKVKKENDEIIIIDSD